MYYRTKLEDVKHINPKHGDTGWKDGSMFLFNAKGKASDGGWVTLHKFRELKLERGNTMRLRRTILVQSGNKQFRVRVTPGCI